MNIRFCFQGWVNMDTDSLKDMNENLISLNLFTPEEVLRKLDAGELTLSLADALDSGADCEVELDNFDVEL